MLLPAHPHPLQPAAFFAAVIGDLCRKIAHRGPATPALAPLVLFLCNYLQRKVRRLDRLLTLWQAGRLPKIRHARSKSTSSQTAAGQPALPLAAKTLRLPSRRAWLVRLVQPVAGYGSQLEALLTHPDIQALLAATPQAGRILRPIFRMLGVHPLPNMLHRPPPPRRPRPPKPAPAVDRPTARERRIWLKYSPGDIGETHRRHDQLGETHRRHDQAGETRRHLDPFRRKFSPT